MPKATKEWGLVCDLMKVKDQMNHKNQREFVEHLYELLDEFSPISEQQSESQIEYLYSLYKKYIKESKK